MEVVVVWARGRRTGGKKECGKVSGSAAGEQQKEGVQGTTQSHVDVVLSWWEVRGSVCAGNCTKKVITKNLKLTHALVTAKVAGSKV